jgi:hypothetical protein
MAVCNIMEVLAGIAYIFFSLILLFCLSFLPNVLFVYLRCRPDDTPWDGG